MLKATSIIDRSSTGKLQSPCRLRGTSTVLCGDDLKSVLGALPAEPVFGTAGDAVFRLMKDTRGARLHCAQQLEHDARKFVCCGCNRQAHTELSTDPAEQLSHAVLDLA